jgi:hypothetical protein
VKVVHEIVFSAESLAGRAREGKSEWESRQSRRDFPRVANGLIDFRPVPYRQLPNKSFWLI